MSQLAREDLAEILFQEVDGYLPQIKTNLISLQKNSADLQVIGETHRLFHNIKGAASQVGFMELSDAARKAEELLDQVLDHGKSFDQVDLDFASGVYEAIAGFCQSPDRSHEAEIEFFETIENSAGAEETREEYLTSLRSVLPLLHELIDFSPLHGEELPRTVFEPMSKAISTLASCSETAELYGHQQLLSNFLLVLEQIRDTVSVPAAEVLPFLKEVISYLDIVFSLDTETAGPVIQRITERFSSFSVLLSGEKTTFQKTDEVAELEDVQLPMGDEVEGFLDQEALEMPDVGDELFDDGEDFFTEDLSESGDNELDELAGIFQAECEEHLLVINRTVNTLEESVHSEKQSVAELRDTLAEMRRAVHTLKGAAAMTGFSDLSSCAHGLEDLLDWLHDESSVVTRKDVSVIASAIDAVESLSADMTGNHRDFVTTVLANITGHLDQRKGDVADEGPEEVEQQPVVQPAEVPGRGDEDGIIPGTGGNVRVHLEDLDELSSIEGELVVARGAIEKLVEQLGQSLGDLSIARDALGRKTQELEVGFEAQSLYGFGPSPAAGALPVMDETVSSLSDFDPIELDRYSQLNLIIRSLNEISIDVNAIHNQINSVAREINGQVSKQQLAMGVMQEKLMRIRMTPLSEISRMLYQTVRQTAAKLGKEVQLVIKGEDVFMDRYVWSRVLDPVMHLLRNSIDHGIEEKDARVAAGKSQTGKVTVNAVQRNRFVVLQIRDDGQGIDTELLWNVLVSKGLLDGTESLSEEELMRYLFLPSFSTRDDISQISGRGVGLDVVQKNIQELRGNVKVENRPGKGLTFELYIPITLSINRALIIELADNNYAVPIQDILEVRRFSEADVKRGEDSAVLWQGKRLNFIDLASRLQLPVIQDVSDGFEGQLFLVLESEDEYHAFRVDSVTEQREIVIKDLGSHLKYVRGINGVTLTGDGEIIPILNMSELATEDQLSVSTVQAPHHFESGDKELQVLIVDDSISVRYSITRLVEGQSWQPYQAVDGIDALEKLEELTPDVIVLDIEMPRMNGYEFMSSIRNDDRYSAIPVVMLTSRASEKHRQKGLELGVNAYVTKPYDEEDFISLLRSTAKNQKDTPQE